MTNVRLDTMTDALLQRLDVGASPDEAFVAESLAELLPRVRRARAQDRTPVGRLWNGVRGVGASWSPDLRLVAPATLVLLALILAGILVIVGSARKLPPPYGLAANGQIAYVVDGHVQVADRDGSHPRQITFEAGIQQDPTFSRDGTKLSYRRFPPGAIGSTAEPGDVVVTDPSGSNVVVVATGLTDLSHISWSPSGERLAFSGSVDGDPASVWIARADAGAPLRRLDLFDGTAWDPVWSPDGSQLALAAAPGLVVIDEDGTHARVLNHDTYTEVGQKGESAEWSPDGTMITFTGGEPGGPTQVYVVGLDGSPERRISVGAENAAHGTWSPDGAHIAFLRNGVGLGPMVVIADPVAQRLRTLPGSYAWFQPLWSPDGTQLIVTDDHFGPTSEPGPAVRVILDAVGDAPPIVIEAPGPTADAVPDWAASWQRLAP
jgi:dipeptidyl aminopeptidase/acylaminoacyl peptidase